MTSYSTDPEPIHAVQPPAAPPPRPWDSSPTYSPYPSYADPSPAYPSYQPDPAADSVPASAPPEDELGPILGSYASGYPDSYSGPPAARDPQPGEAVPERARRRRYRDDGEPNEVMSRLLGR